MIRVVLLGATGSVGRSTLDVLRRNRERFCLYGVAAQRNWADMAQIIREFSPRWAWLSDAPARAKLAEVAGDCALLDSEHSLCAALAESAVDRVVAAVAGSAGLPGVVAAVRAGKCVLLANKEALVMAGTQVMALARAQGAEILPIDSEHNALFQCLPRAGADEMTRLTLTASGGPFRCWSAEQIAQATPEQALQHPNWSMGAKITIDSASMMNKGLELIEAWHLFGGPLSRFDVLVHPQSIVHSLVSYRDGSTLAQLGYPDMRTPIAHALAWPERIDAGVAALDLAALGQLHFEAADPERFPALNLARAALNEGDAACVYLNAANEVVVQRYLQGGCAFSLITDVVAEVLARRPAESLDNLEAVLAADTQARALTHAILRQRLEKT